MKRERYLFYVLAPDGRTPVPLERDDWLEWAGWLELKDRQVALTVIGDTRVSTIFLALDMGIADTPRLWETMAFGPDGKVLDVNRYSTYDEAVAGHKVMAAKYLTALKEQE